MLFASNDPALTGFAIFIIIGCWALWFFAIRVTGFSRRNDPFTRMVHLTGYEQTPCPDYSPAAVLRSSNPSD